MLDPSHLDRLRKALMGRYTLERELGRGGMATVFLAAERHPRRYVALKVLDPSIARELGPEQFLLEVDLAAKLTHPNILPIFSAGEADGFLYYTMPYVEGESLRDRLEKEKKLPLDDAVQIAREVADALTYAFSHDVVHRDIKPGNILLEAGHAVVADFGIARAISAAGGKRLTATGVALGTPAYMSPEQGSGQDLEDARSDLYALGCVLYEMLAGDPPFTGETAQAIMARHQNDRPPSLRTIRPTLVPGIQQAIERALAKVPADRFATASQFVAALDAARSGWTARRRRLARGAAVLLVAAGAVLVWQWVVASPPPLDARKIVVFPLVDHGEQSTGEKVALMIGSALENTEPLKWIDGWTWLGVDERADITRLTPRLAQHIAWRRGARYYLGGSIVQVGQTVTVILSLTDAKGDSLVKRASKTGPAGATLAATLGLEAVNELLPELLQPGRHVDVTVLQGRTPAATASFLQGERAYARGRFRDALDHYRLAVRADSTFALAALKGAQAASWDGRYPEASELIRLARAHDDDLAPRYKLFVRAFQAYYAFTADSAVTLFRRALRIDPEWPQAWAGLGEVYTHLLPRDSPLDSLAESAFTAAHRLDPGFAPVLYHLIQIVLRKGDTDEAGLLIRELHEGQADSLELAVSDLMLQCVQRGADAVDWRSATLRSPRVVTEAGMSLTVGGLHQPDCARAAWEATLAYDTTPPPGGVSYRWGALQGLQDVLLAQRRYGEITQLLERDTVVAPRFHDRLYLLDATAATDSTIAAKASGAAARLRAAFRSNPTDMSNQSLWYLGIWEAHRGRAREAGAIAGTLAARAARSGEREDALLAHSMAARAALARGDTSEALSRLESLVPFASRRLLLWQPWQSLGGERLLLAELLVARRRFVEATRIASNFDAPAAVPYTLFLPASLVLRWRAAVAQHDRRRAERVRKRLLDLGQDDPASGP